MKEKLLLVGAGSFGRVVLEHCASRYDCAFLDDGDILAHHSLYFSLQNRAYDKKADNHVKMTIATAEKRSTVNFAFKPCSVIMLEFLWYK